MAHKVTMYQCDFCRRKFASKSYAEKEHEPVCLYNPKRKGCVTCKHFNSSIYDDQDCMLKNINLIDNKVRVECSLHVPKEIEY